MSAQDFAQINQQLTLAMQRNDEANLEEFCWSGNELLQQQIQLLIAQEAASANVFYLWGTSGSGKTYLLQALCQEMTKKNSPCVYLPLKLLRDWDPAILEGMSEYQFVAVDDIEHIAGDKPWEEALFHLYNRLHTENKKLMITSQKSPMFVSIQLADLRSRLAAAFIAQIHELGDEDKINTLQNYAKKCGLELSNNVGHYILNHCARNMHELHEILEKLDHASLVAQRKLTIPFVKNVLTVSRVL